VPVLGDIPLLGSFFRHKGGDSDKNKERELLIFITPRIIKDTSIQLAQNKKAVVPEREQNTVSGSSRDLAISSSLTNYEKKKK
jgi:type II secretory pathway component GspD/PulD (secretin)